MSGASLFGLGVPRELLEYLDKIHSDVIEVKERVIRIEAQDHLSMINKLRADVDEGKKERFSIEMELVRLKTKIAPVIVGISMIGGSVIDYLFHLIK